MRPHLNKTPEAVAEPTVVRHRRVCVITTGIQPEKANPQRDDTLPGATCLLTGLCDKAYSKLDVGEDILSLYLC